MFWVLSNKSIEELSSLALVTEVSSQSLPDSSCINVFVKVSRDFESDWKRHFQQSINPPEFPRDCIQWRFAFEVLVFTDDRRFLDLG